MSAREYVKESIRNVKKMLENEGRQLPSGTITRLTVRQMSLA